MYIRSVVLPRPSLVYEDMVCDAVNSHMRELWVSLFARDLHAHFARSQFAMLQGFHILVLFFRGMLCLPLVVSVESPGWS